jgi:hypothetical protein
MQPPSFMKPPARGWALIAAMSVASSAQPQSPPPAKSELNSVEFATADGVFQTFGTGGSPTASEMRVRLEDPQQRAKFREEQRQSIAESHYGVADVLQLDPVKFDELIELLADQETDRSAHLFGEIGTRAPAGDPNSRIRAEAARVTRQIDEQRALLGQEKLERYQALEATLGQRYKVRELDQRLAAADRLNGTQRERLVTVLSEQGASTMEQRHAMNFKHSPFLGSLGKMPSREELQRYSQLQTITLNEEIWREKPEVNRHVRERAAAFLTGPQLTMLAQMQAEQLASMQQHIEQMRVQAGLSATIPEQPDVTEVPPAIVSREVKLSIKVAVDSESPRYLTTVVSGGESVTLKISDRLSLEATPIVFEGDAYNLRVQYFETGATGKRQIGNMGQSGTLEPARPDSAAGLRGGGGSTVLTGSKGYAVELSAVVEAT